MNRTLRRRISALCAAALLSACAASTEVETRHRLVVKAYIDGSDFLVLRGHEVWWVHRSWDLPGQHESSDLPTYLNGKSWLPQWEPGEVSRRVTIAEERPASSHVAVRVSPVQARGRVVLVEKPSLDNAYSAVVLFDDDAIFDADWYEVALEWS